VTLVSLDEALESESSEPTPEQYSVNRENYIHLYRSLARLSSEGQELIQLRYGEGLRLVEIAARLRRPDGTVRKRLLRTLRRLRTLYDQPHMPTQKEKK
jgi:RNA polymerase sigma factor (sigma-70 family)